LVAVDRALYVGEQLMFRLYAHRGAAAELPENTLPAFRLALDVGANAIETDCHVTRDGRVVLSHDETGERMANVACAIADATLEDVQTWDVARGFVEDGGEAREAFTIPTLEEALAELRGIPLNVDIKAHQHGAAERVVAVVRRMRATETTLLTSFDARVVRRVRALGYEGPTGLGQSEALRLLAMPTAALRALPLRGTAAQLPHRHGAIDVGRRAVIAKCHALGLAVHFWTVNDPARARELRDLGADGVMTDDPRTIAAALAR
jgi:glycerophosphoryl diester phosphodiesterase